MATNKRQPTFKVLHILAPAPYGGLERVVSALANAQAAAGHEVHVATLVGVHESAHAFRRSLTSSNVTVHIVAEAPRAYLRQSRRLREVCLRVAPDVLHTHGYHADILAGRVGRQLGLRTVTTLHGFTAGDWKNRCYEWLQRRELRSYHAVVAVARAMAPALLKRGVSERQLSVIQNAWVPTSGSMSPVAARAALRVPADRFHVGWVGRVSHEKGLDTMVQALPHLDDLPVILSIIGDGHERARLTALARELGVAEKLIWHGVQEHAVNLFAAFDVFVISSRTEGTPMVLFEAMAADIPVVATSVGGIPDIVSEREALLIPPDRPRALATALREVHAQRSAALERSRAARARLQTEFGAQRWLERYDQLYSKLLNAIVIARA